MDNFKIIYSILKYLETAMDFAEPDHTPIKAETLDITKERWRSIVKMLADEGYVEGVTLRQYVRQPVAIINFNPRITLKGLEYLNENNMMKKVVNTVKGIKEVNP